MLLKRLRMKEDGEPSFVHADPDVFGKFDLMISKIHLRHFLALCLW